MYGPSQEIFPRTIQDYKSCVVELVAAGGKSDDAVALSRVNGTAEQGAFLCCCEPLGELFTRNETGISGIVLNADHISGKDLRRTLCGIFIRIGFRFFFAANRIYKRLVLFFRAA